MNRIYPAQVRTVVAALQAIFLEDQFADRVIERALKADRRQGARDRAFIAENVYEIVRWYRLLYEILGHQPRTDADWWRLFGIRWVLGGGKLPDWQEFRGLDPAAIQRRHSELVAERSVRESIPDWLDHTGEAELADKWAPTLLALNQPARVVLRVNRLLTDKEKLQHSLAGEGIRTQALGGDALLVTERKNLFRTQAFRDGWFEVQDYSSQQVAPLLAPEAGMRVIDACAGGGGKTLHLATLMENRGQIIALDTEAWKLNELKKRARRNAIHIVETRPIESSKVIKRLDQNADRLLLDVPCSGLGVLRRNPDAKWKLSADFLERVRKLQAEILERYPRMLRPGGRMVYATCSVLPSENQAQVARFLASEAGQNFRLLEERAILPQDEGFDGFYLAALQRD